MASFPNVLAGTGSMRMRVGSRAGVHWCRAMNDRCIISLVVSCRLRSASFLAIVIRFIVSLSLVLSASAWVMRLVRLVFSLESVFVDSRQYDALLD